MVYPKRPTPLAINIKHSVKAKVRTHIPALKLPMELTSLNIMLIANLLSSLNTAAAFAAAPPADKTPAASQAEADTTVRHNKHSHPPSPVQADSNYVGCV